MTARLVVFRTAAAEKGANASARQRSSWIAEMDTMLGNLPAAARAGNDNAQHAEFVAAWIEACPMTSAAYAGAAVTDADATGPGTTWPGVLGRYLDTLAANWPGLGRRDDADGRAGRIIAGLRRSWITIAAAGPAAPAGTTPGGSPMGSALRTALDTLRGGAIAPQPLYCRQAFTSKALPARNDLDQVIPWLAAEIKKKGYTLDTTFVPAAELYPVHWAVYKATNLPADAGDGDYDVRGTVWPQLVELAGGGLARYEFVTGPTGLLRPERIGDSRPRPVLPGLAAADYPALVKGALVRDFGLADIDDRPDVKRAWSAAELRLLAAALGLLPDRAAVASLGLVRDAAPPVQPGKVHTAFFHGRPNTAWDGAQPTLSALPHLHLSDDVFAAAAPGQTFCGFPASPGPSLDWAVIHEIGHAVSLGRSGPAIDRAVKADAVAPAAQQQLVTLLEADGGLTSQQRGARNAWTATINPHTLAYNIFYGAFNTLYAALQNGSAPAIVAAVPPYAQALTAVRATDQARTDAAAALDAALPQQRRRAVTVSAAVSRMHGDRADAIGECAKLLRFASYATTTGFQPFTEYSRKDAGEWFAETFAMFVTDPHRLWDHDWRILSWFTDGCPGPAGYQPRKIR
jgi:hypothetical protein